MSEDNNILYQKFLDKQLSSEEVAAFEQRLVDDPGFKEGFDLYVILEGHVEEKVKYGDAVGVLRGVGDRRRVKKSEKSFPLKKYKKLLYAVCLLLFAVSILIYIKSELFNKNKLPSYASVREEPTYPNERNGTTELSNTLSSFKISKDIKYIETVNELKNIDINEKYYWLSEMHLILNNTDSTLYYLKKLKPLKYKYQRVLFLEALTYLKDKNETKYFKFLEKHKSDLDSYYLNKLNQSY